MAAAPAPPPRKTKEQPPQVPKRGGKRMSFATERVRVAVRIRPLVAHEANLNPSVRCIDRGALEITTPSAGGETLFVSSSQLFDALPREEQALARQRAMERARHGYQREQQRGA